MGSFYIVIGLIIFSLLHLATAKRDLRQVFISKIGEGPYKGLFAFLAALSFSLALYGFYISAHVEIWQPTKVLILLQSFVLMPISFTLLISSYVSKGTKRITRHPMLIGVALACFGHVMVKGDLAFVLFFGGLGTYALLAMVWSDYQLARSKSEKAKTLLRQTGYCPSLGRLTQRPEDILPRLGALGPVIGLVTYGLAMTYHGQILGVSPLASIVN